MQALEQNFLGKLAKVVYKDIDGEIKIRKGKIIAVEDSGICLRTFEHTYFISQILISEIKTLDGEGVEP